MNNGFTGFTVFFTCSGNGAGAILRLESLDLPALPFCPGFPALATDLGLAVLVTALPLAAPLLFADGLGLGAYKKKLRTKIIKIPQISIYMNHSD